MNIRKAGLGVALFAVVAVVVAVTALGHRSDRLEIDGRLYDRVELQLNRFTISTQANVSLDMDDEGNLVAAWESRRRDRGTYGVAARWIDRSGSLAGPEERVNLERRSMQRNPSVAIGRDGDAWFAWESFLQDGDRGAVISRSDGDERIVNAVTAGDQSEVVVDRLTDGRGVAAWTTTAQGQTAGRIAVRIFDEQGNSASEEIVVDTPAAGGDHLPVLAASGDGGFYTAWARVDESGASSDIFARRFDAEGRPRSPAFPVNEPGAPSIEPSISVDDEGCLIVAWLRLDETTDYDVLFRRFGPGGEPLGPEKPASVETAGWQSGAAVSTAGNGFVVAWNSFTNGGLAADIYARFFGDEGEPLTGDIRVNRESGGIRTLPEATGVRRIAGGGDGRIAFVWEGDSGEGDHSAVNVTLLLPVPEHPAGDLLSGIRRSRAMVASLFTDPSMRLETAAAPYVPPTFDENNRGPLLDGENLIRSDRGVGFTAFTSTGWTPPDPHMAAGPGHLMATVNGGLAAYEKDGTVLWQEDISGSGGFWGSLGATWFVFDPEVIYDPYEDRFIAMANERGSDNHSYFLIGISGTSDPTGPWHKYRLDVTSLAGDDIDSPNIAVDSQAIYLTADFFTPFEKYLVYIVDKSSVIDGGTAVTGSVLHTGTQSFGIPVLYTDDAPAMYMIEHFEGDPSSQVRLWTITDPLGTPALTSFVLPVPVYYWPGNLRSQGTSARPLAFDARFWSCMYRDGSLWAAHHIAQNSSPRTTVSRWYEIDMNGWPDSGSNPFLVQSGTVAPAGEVYCSFNSITTDVYGNTMMVFARSSVIEQFSIAQTFRRASDPPGFMTPPTSMKASAGVYTDDRWGDYSAIVTDPADPSIFWMHHEYTPGGGAWHTWIASYDVLEATAVEQPVLPVRTAVSLSVSPSPSRGETTLDFTLPETADANLEIFTVAGRLVRRVDLGRLSPQNHHIVWDGRDRNGSPVADGIYLVRLTADGALLASGRVVIVR